MAKEQSKKRIEIPMFDGVNTAVSSNISKKQELSHCQNARSTKIGTIEKRAGTTRLGNEITATANHGIMFFENSGGAVTGFYRVSVVSGITTIYYLNTSDQWTALTGDGTGLTANQCSYTMAEGALFIVNGSDDNRYVKGSDGTTVVTSSSSSGHLYNSPKANKVNYFKDRLYLGDLTVGSTNYPTMIMRSSRPLGIVALLDGDYGSGETTLQVTDAKYIQISDSLDVYRGGKKIETLTITDKTEYEITVNATSNTLESADELWVADTYGEDRVFRWASNPSSGEDIKRYDTFKISGGQNDRIKMFTNVNDVMVIGNNNNLSIWNGSALDSLDLDIGCVSDNGYVLSIGSLWFIHYTGIYSTNGGIPKLESAKVDEYISGATKSGLEGAAAGKKGFSVFFAIGDVTLYYEDGSIKQELSDVCLEYNQKQKNWFVHTGIKATEFRTYPQDSDAKALEYASTESNYNIFEFLTETTDDSSSSDNEIIFRADSDNITLGKQFEKICYIEEIILEASRGSSIQLFISVDNGEFYQLVGEAIKGCTKFKATSRYPNDTNLPRCRKIKISVRDTSKNICKISRIAIIYTESNEEENIKKYIHE